MDGGKNFLTCKEAADIAGYTQRHILNIIKKGKLSASRDESGQYFIDKSEFYRVYPKKKGIELIGNATKSTDESSKKLLEEKIRHLEEMVKEKTKINEFLTEQIHNFTFEKTKMLEAITSHSRLLEYKQQHSQIEEKHSIKDSKKRWWGFK